METKKDTSTNSKEKMTRLQKVVVILTAVALAVILIAFAATRYMGSSNIYPIDTTPGVSDTSDISGDTEKEDGNSSDIDDENDSSNSSTPDISHGSSFDDGTSDNSSGAGHKPNKPTDKDEKPSGTSSDSNPGGSSDKSDEPNSTDKPADEDKPDVSEDTSLGINNGDTVTLVGCSESTVTVTVGRETIVIPVQTTVFNGRITKSGVISDSLCGYSIGASIMIYYPDGHSLDGISLSGAYVKADSARLTVSGDYNGDGSKIVFRINGVKLP